MSNIADELTLRAQTAADDAFAAELFRADRAPAFVAAGWPGATLAGMLADQFRLQQASYAGAYPRLDRWIVERGGAPVGRLSVDRGPACWRIVDVVVVPEQRGRGIGRWLVEGVAAAARRAGAAAVELQVAETNAGAIALYRRLGFVVQGGAAGTHLSMRLALPLRAVS